MIFEEIAVVLNKFSVEEIKNKTGLKKGRIYSLRNSCTFYLDYNLLYGLQKLGYNLILVKL